MSLFKPGIAALLLLLLTLTGCATEPIMPLNEQNGDLLFPNTRVLNVRQNVGVEDVTFTVGEGDSRYLSIAVFDSPPRLVGGEIDPNLTPRWRYDGSFTPQSTVGLAEGLLAPGMPDLDQNFFLCQEEPLYWAAWSWEETGHFITNSTRAVNPLEFPEARPRLSLVSARKIGAGPNDTFLRAGAEVQVQLIIQNTGELSGENIRFTLRQNEVTELPLEGTLESIPPGGTVNETVSFTMPADGNYGDEYRFELLFTTNDCVDTGQEFTLRINDVRVSLVDVRLKRILYLPPDIFWDFGLPISFPPDIYYLIFSPTAREIRRSSVIINATDDFPSTPCLADWADLNPVLDLSIDSTYSIQFWDEDPFDADDEIATITFRPLDYVDSRPELLIDTTTEVITELVLQWE